MFSHIDHCFHDVQHHLIIIIDGLKSRKPNIFAHQIKNVDFWVLVSRLHLRFGLKRRPNHVSWRKWRMQFNDDYESFWTHCFTWESAQSESEAFDASELQRLQMRLRFRVRLSLISEVICFQLQASSFKPQAASLKPQISNLKSWALSLKPQGLRFKLKSQGSVSVPAGTVPQPGSASASASVKASASASASASQPQPWSTLLPDFKISKTGGSLWLWKKLWKFL